MRLNFEGSTFNSQFNWPGLNRCVAGGCFLSMWWQDRSLAMVRFGSGAFGGKCILVAYFYWRSEECLAGLLKRIFHHWTMWLHFRIPRWLNMPPGNSAIEVPERFMRGAFFFPQIAGDLGQALRNRNRIWRLRKVEFFYRG